MVPIVMHPLRERQVIHSPMMSDPGIIPIPVTKTGASPTLGAFVRTMGASSAVVTARPKGRGALEGSSSVFVELARFGTGLVVATFPVGTGHVLTSDTFLGQRTSRAPRAPG